MPVHGGPDFCVVLLLTFLHLGCQASVDDIPDIYIISKVNF